jgi:glycosyltransferase involved in cell wall biosynthesis
VRVIHTESSTGWGGQENRTLQEALQMRERGVDILLVCQPGSGLGQRGREHGFDVAEVPMKRSLSPTAVFALAAEMRRFRPDIVNTHSGRDTLLAGFAARLGFPRTGRRPRVVRTRHLILPITSRISYSWLPDRVVTVSHAVRENLIGSGVPAGMITTITTGVDCTRFDPARTAPVLRQELGIGDGTLLVGMVAILRFKKGHLDLLDAAVEVAKALPDVRFVLAGNGPQRENLERAIAERGLQQRVHLLGLRRDIPDVLRSLDLFVLPTHQEAFGTSFLEAQAMGVPVIGTDVGGVGEAVNQGVSGLLVPPHDPQALAAAILALGRDPQRRSAMSAAGRPWVLAEHSTGKMAERMLALYRELLLE